jgi:CHAT domain-containing protein
MHVRAIIYIGFLAGLIPILSAEEVSEEKISQEESILLEATDLSPVELLGSAYDAQKNGDYLLALDFLKAAKVIAEKDQNNALMAHVFIQLSDLYLLVGQRNEAESFGYKALTLASDINDDRLLAASWNNWGNVLVQYENYNAAINAYDESFILSKNKGDTESALRALINMSRTALSLDELEIAYDALSQAKLFIDEFPDHSELPWQMQFASQSQALALQNLKSEVQEELNEWAKEIWDEVYLYAEQNKKAELLSRACGNLGALYESKGDYAKAVQLTRRSLFWAESAQQPKMSYNWYWQLGRLYKLQERPEEALDAYREAVKFLSSIRNQLLSSQRDKRGFFKKKIKPLYYELAELCIEIADKDETLAETYLKDSRKVVEKMKQVELENLFNDECIAQFKSRSVSLDRTPEGTALFYPMIFPERLVVLIAIGNDILPFVIPVDAETVTENVLAFRKNLQTRSNKLFYKPGSMIYDLIIRPAKEILEENNVDTLVFVPDGVFSLIPFAPLFDLEKNEFLIEQYAVATSLGLELADPQPLNRENIEILLLGLSHAVQDHSALPSVPKELETIASMFPGEYQELLNDDFSEENVVNALQSKSFRILHMATHGEFGHDPDDSYLLTYGGKLNFDKLESLIKLSKFRDDPVELLTLSACRTAVGDEQAALGLAGVAVKSGARSAIASLWYIDDEASMLAISGFYRELVANPQFSKAQALQAAQLKLIRQDRYWHPSYWAPFLLIGNWL